MDNIYFVFWLGIMATILKMVISNVGNKKLGDLIEIVALVVVLAKVLIPMLQNLMSIAVVFSNF